MVFEHMCTVDRMVRSKLRPCSRRLVSADLSHLTVTGELELNVFRDCVVTCYMWWPVLDRMACWVRKPCSRACHISWISNGTVVGGRPVNVTITPAETDPRGGWILDDFGGVAAGQ